MLPDREVPVLFQTSMGNTISTDPEISSNYKTKPGVTVENPSQRITVQDVVEKKKKVKTIYF